VNATEHACKLSVSNYSFQLTIEFNDSTVWEESFISAQRFEVQSLKPFERLLTPHSSFGTGTSRTAVRIIWIQSLSSNE
jgi:hypothetical protein